MSAYPFKVGGGLTTAESSVYVERQADKDITSHLIRMEYVLVIEPRQQGKTSLVNALIRNSTLEGTAFVYLDVTVLDNSDEQRWYNSLCKRLLRQLRFISRDLWPSIPDDGGGWRDFLSDLAYLAEKSNLQVVIALDEIGAVDFPGSTGFFSVLRDIYNSRQVEPEFRSINFLLTGAFHPRDLISDEKVSPFNIAHRVRLPDFSLEQVGWLTEKGGWPQPRTKGLAEQIHFWTDGQPYMTQLLLSYLGSQAEPAHIDDGIERLRREDENHLPPMLHRLEQDKKLIEYLGRIQKGERPKFFPGENRRQAQLELLGIIKADNDGYCRIRNRIYEKALETFYNQMEKDTAEATSVPQQDTSSTSDHSTQYHIQIQSAEGLVIGDRGQVKAKFEGEDDSSEENST
jgi:hypothetical protein